MRAAATGLLIVMALVFVAASLAAPRWPALAWLRAFAEAAMVGGCADWFAVTALFRRPLGLPIPHTAIVPRSRERIGEALGRFIVENFLSARVLDARLRQLELAAWGGQWLERPENARRVAARVVAWSPEILRLLPTGSVEDIARSVALAAIRSVPAAPTASRLLAALWNDGRFEPLIERAADALIAYVGDHRQRVLAEVEAQSWRWLPKWINRAIAEKITAGLIQFLLDVRQPGHPWRGSLALGVERWIARLADDPYLRREGEALKQRLLADPRLADHAGRLWADLRGQLESDWAAGSEALEAKIGRWLSELGGWIRDEPALQRTLNTSARVFVRSILAPRRQQIGRFIAQVVAGWDTKSIVERLELQVGPDLQYIRINGALVGGLVGLALFAASRALGLG